MKKALMLLSAAAMIAACAGTPVDWSKARTVTVGMTEKQLTEVMGAPYMVTSRGQNQIWVYSYAGAFTGMRAVSYVMREGKVAEVPTIPESFR